MPAGHPVHVEVPAVYIYVATVFIMLQARSKRRASLASTFLIAVLADQHSPGRHQQASLLCLNSERQQFNANPSAA